MNNISVLIVDDHAIVRQGLRMILATEPTIQIAGEALDGHSAVSQFSRLQPDVILLDLVMPGGNGLEAINKIKQLSAQVKIIVLTTFEDDNQIHAAIEAGADGYILKDADGGALIQAIKAVQRGEMPLHPRVAHHLFKGSAGGHYLDFGKTNCLTEREHEVLQLIANGLSNKEIADTLELREGTVKIHVSNILGKLNVSCRTEAAVKAVQMGWASPKQGDY